MKWLFIGEDRCDQIVINLEAITHVESRHSRSTEALEVNKATISFVGGSKLELGGGDAVMFLQEMSEIRLLREDERGTEVRKERQRADRPPDELARE